VLESSDYIAANGVTTFAGRTIDSTAVLVKYTWYGDTDLNGVVDFDDYVRTDAGFNAGRTGWLNGDFDLNGSIDFDDYVLIDLGFNTQTGDLRRAQAYLSSDDRSARGMDSPPLQLVARHFEQFGVDYARNFLAAVPEPVGAATVIGCVLAACRPRRRRGT
jgi:hypothetical protein